jgi:hypothetical protein
MEYSIHEEGDGVPALQLELGRRETVEHSEW